MKQVPHDPLAVDVAEITQLDAAQKADNSCKRSATAAWQPPIELLRKQLIPRFRFACVIP